MAGCAGSGVYATGGATTASQYSGVTEKDAAAMEALASSLNDKTIDLRQLQGGEISKIP